MPDPLRIDAVKVNTIGYESVRCGRASELSAVARIRPRNESKLNLNCDGLRRFEELSCALRLKGFFNFLAASAAKAKRISFEHGIS